MKILHIYKDYYPIIGGIENYIRILAESQVKKDFDVTVLATSLSRKTTTTTFNGVKVVKTARLTTLSSTPISLSLLKYIHKLKVDITHLHFPFPPGEFWHLFFGKSSRTIITYHSDIVKQQLLLKLYKPFLVKILEKADRIIATSPQYIETSPFLKKMKNKCIVIPLGIDISRFRQPDKVNSERIRKKYNNSSLLLFVGRLRYFKGLQYLLEAMKSVDAQLLIIGTGPEQNSLKRQVDKDSLNGKVSFLDDVPDSELPSYYCACDLFVLPSSHRSEAFGTVLIEAMASGKPVISTEIGTGTSFINVHGKTGIVVPPKNPEALAQAINKVLHDGSLLKEFSINARNRAAEFSEEVLNKKVIKVYKDVLYSNTLTY